MRRTSSPAGGFPVQDAGRARVARIDTIELCERNMIDELTLRLVYGELPVGT